MRSGWGEREREEGRGGKGGSGGKGGRGYHCWNRVWGFGRVWDVGYGIWWGGEECRMMQDVVGCGGTWDDVEGFWSGFG